MTDNRQITLAKRPEGSVDESCFAEKQAAVPAPAPSEALGKVEWLSIDPTIRMWMAMDTYLPAIEIGAPIRSAGLVRVVESENPKLPVGTLVFSTPGWQEYSIVSERDQVVPEGVDPTAALSIFGITGITAYYGLLDIGRPQEGDTVVVSGAAGSTGSIVGQIAKIKGCRVIGIAGTDEKCAWLTDELGFDAAINYRADNVGKALRDHCPNGIDIYFDNVGGDILEMAIANLALHGRIVMCGAISQYNDDAPTPGPRNLSALISKRGRIEGFIVLDYLKRSGEAIQDLATWLMEGRLTYKVDVMDGLDSAPEALMKLFSGSNTGKMIVRP
jgi:NADPH-dependent curcumin reductase CurA